MDNYVCYHLHSDNSLLDSCTSYKEYIDYAVSLGQKAIGFSEHGRLDGWGNKYLYCKEKGIKYLHAVEVYLTETHEEKIKDNYHTILLSKNMDGFIELNKLVKLSSRKDHRYYKRRLSFEEFFNISPNIIKLSACLQSPLNKYRQKVCSEEQNNILNRLLETYDYYEIQYHNMPEQIEYNRYLYKMSKVYGKKLIVGTDSHSIDAYHAECRTILQWGKTDNAWGDSENECDLTYKSRPELEQMFLVQNSLPMDVIEQAIDETNRMADSVEELEFDTKDKYPILYGKDDERVLWYRLADKYKDKVRKGIIDGNNPQYLKNIKEEMRVYKKINMIGFMLFMSELLTWIRDNGIAVGFSRGSCSGSTVAYIGDITDIDPVIWNCNFSRFANENRVTAGDIDIDLYEDDRQKAYDYIINRFGTEKTAYILAMGSLAEKATIDVIGKALSLLWCRDRGIDYKKEGKDHPDNPYTLDKIAKIKKEFDLNKEETIANYPDIFYYYDGLNGCLVSQSIHPAGIVVSPSDICDISGVTYNENEQLVTNLNMDELHNFGYVKYDLLGLKTVGVIDKTYKLLGSKFPSSYEVNWDDQDVFNDIANDHLAIFQFESDYAGQCLPKFHPKSVRDLALLSACIRPSAASFRDEVFAKNFHKNPTELIDNILKDSYGYITYQEQIISFLQLACGFSGSDADTIRRAIGSKNREKIDSYIPKIIDGYCQLSDKPRKVSEQEVKDFVQVIEDASGYGFSYNHSISYSMLSYMMGYLRYYHPTEFCTSYLNCAKNDEDIINGTKVALSKGCQIKNPKFRMSSGDYGCDPSTKTIYKGISSIKDMGKEVGDYLYSLKDEKFNSFIDVLKKIDSKIVNDKSLQILIKIDFFSEFGDINYLLKVYDLFKKFYGRKQVNKDSLNKLGISEDVLRLFSTETDKQFREIDSNGLLNYLIKNFAVFECSEIDKLKYQIKLLGHTDIVIPSKPRRYVITNVDSNKAKSKYTIETYEVCSGKSRTLNIWGNTYKRQPFEVGDLIYIYTIKKDFKRERSDEINPKTKKNIWKPVKDQYEFWLQSYEIIL